MIEHVRLSVTDILQRTDRASEIGNQDFDPGLPASLADMVNRSAELLGTAIDKIIARYRGDDNVIQVQHFGRPGNSLRLFRIHCPRFALVHCTKAAGACAAGAQDHERRRAPVETFP